jgi:hypothetical protein
MTKNWEREFVVSRMREDPTISYRALAKVLGVSDSTVRQWRDEEGIRPRPHHNTGRRNGQGRSVPGLGESARPIVVPRQDRDDDGENFEDDQQADDAELDDNDDEEFELDDVPATSRAASLVRTWETIGQTIGQLDGLRLGLKAARPSPTGRLSRIASAPKPTPSEDPRARLRAITVELDSRTPRGSNAVELLVEATSYLTGGVIALRQYAEARGCDPKDARAAERAVLGLKERGRRA